MGSKRGEKGEIKEGREERKRDRVSGENKGEEGKRAQQVFWGSAP